MISMLVVLTGVLAGIAVSIDPALDLKIAAYFQMPAVKAALLPFHPWFDAARDCNVALGAAFVLVAAGTLVIKFIWPHRASLMSARTALLILVTSALGPALLANGILKPHSGRPRPAAVVELGGTQPFVQWWDWRGQCDGNCSFVSGEAAGAYALLAPAAVASAPWRAAAIGTVVVYGTAIGVMRMAVGSHFATDVVFAGVFIALVVWLMHGCIYRWRSTRLTEDDVELFLGLCRARIKTQIARFLIRCRRVAVVRRTNSNPPR
jgi:membrane-associated PAP2 superfamily phosphatase